MSPLVFGLLIVALVLFILSFIPPLASARQSLWVGAVIAAVVAILVYLFVPALGRV